MAEASFLRSFTFNGQKTSHLFQIEKISIPFLSKENEYYEVGNTDGSNFFHTRVTKNSIKIDGYLLKDNSNMTIYKIKDELVKILNTDEPVKLVFDQLPDRYFNAIFSGSVDHDVTNPDQTSVSLTFDVPDGLAHQIEPSGFTNVYTTEKNLFLDSEFEKIDKYLKPWVFKVDELNNGSAVVSADFTNGVPLNFERDDNQRWLQVNSMTRRKVDNLSKNSSIAFSIDAWVTQIDEEDKDPNAGSLILEEWTTDPANIVERHIVPIPKKVGTGFEKFGTVVRIKNPKTTALNLAFGFNGSNIIKWSQPMFTVLEEIPEPVQEPIVGATLFSNSLDFGDYDYSGNPNLMCVIKASDFRKQRDSDVLISDVGHNSIRLTSQKVNHLWVYTETNIPSLASGKTYTMSAKVKIEEGTTGNVDQITVSYRKVNGGKMLLTATGDGTVVGKEIIIKGTSTVNYEIADLSRFYLDIEVDGVINGSVIVRDVKIEEGSTATPYQPNLLTEPYEVGDVPVQPNIANKSVTFPINTTEYSIYAKYNITNYEANQKYVVTMKATKPATQSYVAFLDWQGTIKAGDFVPVEGLTDVWQTEFTVTQSIIEAGVLNLLNIFQFPSPTKGSVKIDWLKLEKGDKRTPNHNYNKYRGLYSYPSPDPNDYAWEYDPTYYRAIDYEQSREGISDVLLVQNNGTYRTYPKFTFKMNGENGLVGLLNGNGGVLQFGNPEDVDGTTSVRTEQGLNENYWGNTLNPNIKVNTGFKSVYPNMNSNPATPNIIQGSFDMKQDADSVVPVFKGVGDINVWHGPTMMMDIQAPANNDRTGEVASHIRFTFNNYDKGQRGRIEFSIFDENGDPAMTTIIRDSTTVGNEMRIECWKKGKRLIDQALDRKTFSKTFYEINMDRRGNRLIWRLVQIKKLNTGGQWSTAQIDKEYKFTWNLDEPDTTKWTKLGIWQMRYSNKFVVLMGITDAQVRWEKTPYYQDIKNFFRDGDLVEIDVKGRALYINGSINNDLNIVGNQWEKFVLELGETMIQPVVSEWANMAEVTATIEESYL